MKTILGILIILLFSNKALANEYEDSILEGMGASGLYEIEVGELLGRVCVERLAGACELLKGECIGFKYKNICLAKLVSEEYTRSEICNFDEQCVMDDIYFRRKLLLLITEELKRENLGIAGIVEGCKKNIRVEPKLVKVREIKLKLGEISMELAQSYNNKKLYECVRLGI